MEKNKENKKGDWREIKGEGDAEQKKKKGISKGTNRESGDGRGVEINRERVREKGKRER